MSLLSSENLVPSDPTVRVLPFSCYGEAASDVWEATAGRPLEERNEALIRFFEEKEKELNTIACSEVLGDESDEEESDEEESDEEDAGICKLGRGSDELVQVSVKGEAGMADSSENHIKGCSHVTSEFLAALARSILEEINEGLGKDNSDVISEVMDADEDEKAGEIGKLLGHENKHSRNEGGQVSVEGEQERKKGRMAESSGNKGEDVEPL